MSIGDTTTITLTGAVKKGFPRWAIRPPGMKGHCKSIFTEADQLSACVNQYLLRWIICPPMTINPKNRKKSIDEPTEPIHVSPPLGAADRAHSQDLALCLRIGSLIAASATSRGGGGGERPTARIRPLARMRSPATRIGPPAIRSELPRVGSDRTSQDMASCHQIWLVAATSAASARAQPPATREGERRAATGEAAPRAATSAGGGYLERH